MGLRCATIRAMRVILAYAVLVTGLVALPFAQRTPARQASHRRRSSPQRHPDPGRRSGLRRPELLRAAEVPHAAPRPHGPRGEALHAVLLREHRLRPVARGAPCLGSTRATITSGATARSRSRPERRDRRRGPQGRPATGRRSSASGGWGRPATVGSRRTGRASTRRSASSIHHPRAPAVHGPPLEERRGLRC